MTVDAETSVVVPPARRRKGPLLFVPQKWQRRTLLITLKRVHAWTGLWGAALFLLLGTSGVLLNHRSVLLIDVGGSVSVTNVLLPVDPRAIVDEAALGEWAHRALGLSAAVKPLPVADTPAKPRPVRFLGRQLATAPAWARSFNLPNQKVTVTYAPGSPAVAAKVEALGVLAVTKNLHKGTGLGVIWVLLMDSIAGALIAMSLTGFLLWSRLHGSRLLAGGLATGAIIWAVVGSVPLLG